MSRVPRNELPPGPGEKPRDPEGRELSEAQVRRAMEVAQRATETRTDLRKLEAAVVRSERFAYWMDKRYIEAAAGIVTGFGDTAGALAGLYIVAEALRAGVPKGKIARMLLNIATDAGLGVIPVIGDLADFLYKSNAKNAAIFREYLEKEKSGGEK